MLYGQRLNIYTRAKEVLLIHKPPSNIVEATMTLCRKECQPSVGNEGQTAFLTFPRKGFVLNTSRLRMPFFHPHSATARGTQKETKME